MEKVEKWDGKGKNKSLVTFFFVFLLIVFFVVFYFSFLISLFCYKVISSNYIPRQLFIYFNLPALIFHTFHSISVFNTSLNFSVIILFSLSYLWNFLTTFEVRTYRFYISMNNRFLMQSIDSIYQLISNL